MIQMPRPCVASTDQRFWDERRGRGRRRRGSCTALVLRPANASIVADPETKFSAEEEQVGVDRVLFDNVRVSTPAMLPGYRAGANSYRSQ